MTGGSIMEQQPMARPLVSVVIPTLNGSRLTERCLSSFARTVQGIDCELIVVDDGSEEGEKERLRALASAYGSRLIELPQRSGFARAVNAGLRAAAGRHLLLLNNDIYFHEPDWLGAMLRTMNEGQRVGIVGCRLLYSDLTIQHGGGALSLEEGHIHLHRGKPADAPEAGLSYDAVSVTGAVMLVRREVTDDIGLLSEDYPLSYEDVDFCLRARKAGWRVVYCGRAAAIHDEGSTRGMTLEDKPAAWHAEERESYRLFWSRWADDEFIALTPSELEGDRG